MASVRDVVCGMMVDTATAEFTSVYRGQTYYFCSAECKRSFDQDPESYLVTQSSSENLPRS